MQSGERCYWGNDAFSPLTAVLTDDEINSQRSVRSYRSSKNLMG